MFNSDDTETDNVAMICYLYIVPEKKVLNKELKVHLEY